jgi:hypothetical protein
MHETGRAEARDTFYNVPNPLGRFMTVVRELTLGQSQSWRGIVALNSGA